MSKAHKKIERLFLFGEVANCLSFTAAAEQLGISKGYLSAQVKQLEQELASPLLVRSTRHVRLTKAGAQVAKQVEEMQRSLLSIERFAKGEQQSLTGDIAITAPKQFFNSVLADICYQFQQLHPEIHFSIDCSYTTYDLIESDFDIAFRATNQPPENMVATQLISYQHLCCAAPQYIAQYGQPVSLTELSHHQCLTALAQEIWEINQQPIAISGWLSANDHSVLLSQALQGNGIIRLPSYVASPLIEQAQLVNLFEVNSSQSQHIYLLRPQLIKPPQKVATFIQFVQANLLEKIA
ncbi:LysR family transcriptional regulator [Colwellia sp. MEBiC06753]